MKKFQSIPESEPLFKLLRSRTIDLSKIKDKEEKKYWSELKRLNRIPSEYIPVQEIMSELSKNVKEIDLW